MILTAMMTVISSLLSSEAVDIVSLNLDKLGIFELVYVFNGKEVIHNLDTTQLSQDPASREQELLDFLTESSKAAAIEAYKNLKVPEGTVIH